MDEHDIPEDTASDETAAGHVIAMGAIPQDALMAKLEALLFVHARPVSARRLAELVGLASVIPVKQALEALQKRYDSVGSAFSLQELAKGYTLTTRPEHDDLLKQLVREREAQKLSPATLEALAIIAYKQPIGRGELENIRGAGSDHLVRALMDRGLVKVTERDTSKPGNPALYGTTAEFLRVFGLRSLSELPTEGDLAAPADSNGDDEEPAIEQTEVTAPETTSDEE
ncbi:MAG: SMC-Scp complex subunit ScpB [Planctomycetes bacterium]|nr:SMC-Scp complex subunit ScpB [Planctomycetota bacterium]MCW8137155.1 SMC-Scp complex subunit ScpB [Planctomycetota bacterium]